MRESIACGLRFADGLEGEIDLTDELWGPAFEPMKDEGLSPRYALTPNCAPLCGPTART